MGILSLIEPAFVNRPRGGDPAVGDLYWVPTGYLQETPTILDVQRSNPEEHGEVEFRLTEIGASHFRGGRSLPIKQLNLEGTEELLVSRGKRRPCVVIARTTVDNIAEITEASQRRLAEKGVGKVLYLVAPCYTTAKLNEREKTFGPQLVARIRALQYPHLFCLPERDKPDIPGSVVRLDRLFASFLARGCEALEYRLSADALEVFLSAAASVLGGGDATLFVEMQNLIRESGLPDEISN